MATYILRNNEQLGPYEDFQIQQALASGTFAAHELAWREGMAEWQPLSVLFPPQYTGTRALPPAVQRGNGVLCQTCGQGSLTKRKVFRMSPVVATIGFILLIPSILGMLLGVLLLFATGSAGASVAAELNATTQKALEEKGIPNAIVLKVLASEPVTSSDREALTVEQRTAVNEATTSIAAGKIGAGAGTLLGGGIAIFFIVCCFVGGLLGWLLIMRKRVLQCNHCGAVVAAS